MAPINEFENLADSYVGGAAGNSPNDNTARAKERAEFVARHSAQAPGGGKDPIGRQSISAAHEQELQSLARLEAVLDELEKCLQSILATSDANTRTSPEGQAAPLPSRPLDRIRYHRQLIDRASQRVVGILQRLEL